MNAKYLWLLIPLAILWGGTYIGSEVIDSDSWVMFPYLLSFLVTFCMSSIYAVNRINDW